MCWLLLTLYDSVIHPTNVYQLPTGPSGFANAPCLLLSLSWPSFPLT